MGSLKKTICEEFCETDAAAAGTIDVTVGAVTSLAGVQFGLVIQEFAGKSKFPARSLGAAAKKLYTPKKLEELFENFG